MPSSCGRRTHAYSTASSLADASIIQRGHRPNNCCLNIRTRRRRNIIHDSSEAACRYRFPSFTDFCSLLSFLSLLFFFPFYDRDRNATAVYPGAFKRIARRRYRPAPPEGRREKHGCRDAARARDVKRRGSFSLSLRRLAISARDCVMSARARARFN